MKIDVLGTKIDALTQQQALEKIESFLTQIPDSRFQIQIITANPEIILAAKKNKEYQDLINSASLVLPDGIGLLWAAKFLSLKSDSLLTTITQLIVSLSSLIFEPAYCKEILPERIAGVDLMEKICELAGQKNWKVYLLGAGEGVAEKAAEVLKKKYPDLQIVGAESGPLLRDTCYLPRRQAGVIRENDIEVKNLINKINDAKPDILFVAMGAPKQDFFIQQILPRLASVKLAMGVGGTFDFISGQSKRAPAIYQDLGLEWLYRFFHEPWRAIRMFNATIRFVWNVVRYKNQITKN